MTILVPLALIDPTASTAGQAVVSIGPNGLPVWGNINFNSLTNIPTPQREVFVAGTGFTPGVSNSITLANTYGSVAAISVHFDASYQGVNAVASLVGKTLTFSSVIPLGVTNIYIDSYSASVVTSNPPVGSVGVAQLASDALSLISASGNAATYTQAGNGTAPITVISRILKTLNLFDFSGIDPTGTTDSTVGLQNAINQAATSGYELTVGSAAVLLISSTITLPSNLNADFGLSTIKRKAGSGSFNMLVSTGTSNLNIRRLIVDGNKTVDGLVSTVAANRFGGIVVTNITNSTFKDIQCNNTVNAEDGRAGFFISGSTATDLYNVGGSGNDKSCLYIYQSQVRVFGSYTINNSGSGLTSTLANDSEYYNILSIGSGYSGISINGLRSKAVGLRAYNGTNAGYSGINIGHDDNSNRSHDSVISDVHTFNNAGWGITVCGSQRVKLRGVVSQNNVSPNVYIFSNSSACEMSGVTASGSTAGSGILITSGLGHKLTGSECYGNAINGIDVETGCQIYISGDVRCYDNSQLAAGQAGVLLNGAVNSVVGAECFDDQGTPTQTYGVWINNGSGNSVTGYIHNNVTSNIRTTGTGAYTTPVTSVAGRQGAITLTQSDIAGLTTANTPAFAGVVLGSGATGTTVGAFTGGGLGAIYSTNITPSTTNYTLAYNGNSTVLNGFTSATVNVAGTPVISAVAAGATVAGTLNISGVTTHGSGTTGTLIQPFTGGGLGAIYSTNVTPSSTNYSLAYNGAGTVLNGNTSATINIAGVPMISVTNGAVSAAATITATGNITAPSFIGSGASLTGIAAPQIAFTQAGTGAVARAANIKFGEVVSVNDFGAKGDGFIAMDGATTSGSAVFTSATGGFTASNVSGKTFIIVGAGVAGATLTTTATYLSATTVTLATAASTTVSGANWAYGTDDTAAINYAYAQLALSYKLNAPRYWSPAETEKGVYSGGKLVFQPAIYITSGFTPNYNSDTDFQGSILVASTANNNVINFSLISSGIGSVYGGELQQLRNVKIAGMGLAKYGVLLQATNWTKCENIWVTGCQHGWELQELQYSTFINCHSTGNSKSGWHLGARAAAPTLTCIDNSFINCSSSWNFLGIWLQEAEVNTWDKIDCSRNTAGNILLGEAYGGSGSGAVLTANIVGGQITSITINNGGSGYTSPPLVIISGNGTFAQYICEVTGGVITNMYAISYGSGYSTATVTAVGLAPTFGELTAQSGINRRFNRFNSLKTENDTSSIPISGHGIWANHYNQQRNYFDANVQRQTSGSGPTSYFKWIRSDAPGNKIVPNADELLNVTFAPAYNASDISLFKSTVNAGLEVEYPAYTNANQIYQYSVTKTNSNAAILNVLFTAFDINSGGLKSDNFRASGAGTYSYAFSSIVNGDSNNRFVQTADGQRAIGSGSAAADSYESNVVRVTTTNATSTLLQSYTCPAGSTISIEALLVATGTTNHAGFLVTATAWNNAGTMTLVGTPTVVSSNMTVAGMAATFNVGASTLNLMVTGVASETVKWTANVRYLSL